MIRLFHAPNDNLTLETVALCEWILFDVLNQDGVETGSHIEACE